MKTALKRIGIVIASLVVLLVIALSALYFIGSRKLAGPYQADPAPLTIPSDEVSLERGRRLVHEISLCAVCHGENLGGAIVLDEPGLATIYGPNLTGGQGGVGERYALEDWVRAIRFGIGGDDRGLVVMPSQHFSHMSDGDLGAIIAYLQTVPSVNNKVPPRQVSLMATIFIGAGQLDVSADLIAGDPSPQDISPGSTVEYGEYLTTIATCQDCHAGNFAGNSDPNAGPTGPNLTPGGELHGWGYRDFVDALRTGVTPGGRQLDPDQMPWQFYQFSDQELEAIWLFLQSLPELPTNQ